MLSRLDQKPRSDQPLVMLLGNDIDEEDHDLLFPALRDQGISVIRVHPYDLTVEVADEEFSFLVAGQKIEPDLVVGWVLEDLLYPGMAQLEAFSAAGIPVINEALTLFRAQNKFVTSALLAAERALSYPVITGREPELFEDWISGRSEPAVLKPLFGFGGEGLRRVQNGEEASEILATLKQSNEPYYAMPWVDNPGRDIRVYTINHVPVFAMYRYAPTGQWITNVRAGGEIAMCPLTDSIISLASQASRAVGTLIGGIDIGEDQTTGELVVYEVNSCPSCEPPVLEALTDFLAAAARDLDSALMNWRPEKVYDRLDEDAALFHRSKQRLIRK